MTEDRVAAQELEPVAGPRRLPPAEIGEGDPTGELPVPGVTGEHGSGRAIDGRDDVGSGAAAGDPQDPLRIGGDGQPPCAAGAIHQSEARDLDGVPRRYQLQEIQCDAMGRVLEPTVALPVPDDVR